MPTDRDFKDFTSWDVSGGRVLNPCFCTGKCRSLGYCPANPPVFISRLFDPLFYADRDARGLPIIRTKAWREPNEDGRLREIEAAFLAPAIASIRRLLPVEPA